RPKSSAIPLTNPRKSPRTTRRFSRRLTVTSSRSKRERFPRYQAPLGNEDGRPSRPVYGPYRGACRPVASGGVAAMPLRFLRFVTTVPTMRPNDPNNDADRGDKNRDRCGGVESQHPHPLVFRTTSEARTVRCTYKCEQDKNAKR